MPPSPAPIHLLPSSTITDPEIADRTLRRIYGEGDLSLRSRGPIKWTVAAANLGPVAMGRGRIEGRSDLHTVIPFYLIHLATGGSARARLGDFAGETVARRRGLVASPDMPLELGYGPDVPCETLTTRIDRSLVEAQLEAMLGEPLRTPLRFAPELRSDEGPAAALERLLDFFFGELVGAPSLYRAPVLVSSMSEAIVGALLLAQPHSHTHLLHRPAPDAGPRAVAVAAQYMEAHAIEPLRMADVARAANVSVRVLEKSFRAARGITPAQFLRARRLALAHGRLLAATPETKVTAVAAEFGFLNVGRFSAEHRAQFGELPGETLRRALRAHADAGIRPRRGG